MTEKSKRITDFLEDHLEVWREDPEFMAKYKVVVDYVRNTLKLNLNEDKILRVITSSYTNDFSHSLANGNQAQMMFPLTAMMNHSCQPSISRSITVTGTRESPEFRMRVVAAKSLIEGEQIYNSYIDILDPVQVRRSHLALTKHMDCRCEPV